MAGTHLLRVPMGHGEMESGLEPPKAEGMANSPPTAPAQGTALGHPTTASHRGVTVRPPGTSPCVPPARAVLTCFKMEQLLESTL